VKWIPKPPPPRFTLDGETTLLTEASRGLFFSASPPFLFLLCCWSSLRRKCYEAKTPVSLCMSDFFFLLEKVLCLTRDSITASLSFDQSETLNFFLPFLLDEFRLQLLQTLKG
jgi:hypothetical protein